MEEIIKTAYSCTYESFFASQIIQTDLLSEYLLLLILMIVWESKWLKFMITK